MTKTIITLLAIFVTIPALAKERILTKPNLKIGIVLPLSGGMAPYGHEVKKGIDTALLEIQKKEPEVFSRIQLVERDNKNLSQNTNQVTQDLIKNEHIHALIGGLSQNNALMIDQESRDQQIPFLSASKLPPNNKSSFTSCLVNTDQGSLLANFVTRDLNKKSAVIVVEESSTAGQKVAESFRDGLQKAGGKVTKSLSYSLSKPDFAALARNILASNPDIIFLPVHYADAKLIIQESKKLGIKAPFVGNDSWDSAHFYSVENGAIMDGNYFLTEFSYTDTDPRVVAFDQQFFEQYKRHPSLYAAIGYESAMTVVTAFMKANSNRGAALNRAIESASCQTFGDKVTSETNTEVGMQNPGVIISTTKTGAQFFKRVKL